jgi:hypothetical protein
MKKKAYDLIKYCTKCGEKLVTETVKTGRKRFNPWDGRAQEESNTMKSCPKMKDISDGHAYHILGKDWINEKV